MNIINTAIINNQQLDVEAIRAHILSHNYQPSSVYRWVELAVKRNSLVTINSLAEYAFDEMQKTQHGDEEQGRMLRALHESINSTVILIYLQNNEPESATAWVDKYYIDLSKWNSDSSYFKIFSQERFYRIFEPYIKSRSTNDLSKVDELFSSVLRFCELNPSLDADTLPFAAVFNGALSEWNLPLVHQMSKFRKLSSMPLNTDVESQIDNSELRYKEWLDFVFKVPSNEATFLKIAYEVVFQSFKTFVSITPLNALKLAPQSHGQFILEFVGK